MTTAVLALGSNLGDKREWLVKALALISTTPDIYLTDISPVVESKALTLSGVDSSKPSFLNCVAEIDFRNMGCKIRRTLQSPDNYQRRSKTLLNKEQNVQVSDTTPLPRLHNSLQLKISSQ